MKFWINGLLSLFFSLNIISCSKSGDETSSLTNLQPKPEPTNVVNPPPEPPPVIIAPQITAETLANNITTAWNKLRTESYDKKEIDPTTGKTVVKKLRYLPSDAKLGYCFPDFKNERILSNYDPYKTGFELASVSKIFTSLWAVQASKRNYVLLPPQFKTNVSYNYETGELYLHGSLDPMFGIDRLVDALQNIKLQLSKNDIDEFPAITKIHHYNFIQIPIFTSQSTYEMTVRESAYALANSPSLTKKSILNVAKYLQKEKNGFFLNSDFNTFEIISYNTKDDLIDSMNIQSSVSISSYQRPLNQLLFFINTFSHNLGSDLLFQLLGGRDRFFNFLVDFYPPHMSDLVMHGEEDESLHLGYDPKVPFAFYNGSGLPQLMSGNDLGEGTDDESEIENIPSSTTIDLTAHTDATEDQFGEEFGHSKFRNKATCEMIFKAVEGLYDSKLFFKTTLEELMPINGTGTLKRSISKKIPMGTFVGKTGSVNNLLALVGALKTRYGMRPFFISVFRNNLDNNGDYRSNGLSGKASTFVRSTVTTDLVQLMLEYYSQQGFFLPKPDLLAQLNAQTFLARSYMALPTLF
jgi:hypothetical protein